MHLMLSTSARK